MYTMAIRFGMNLAQIIGGVKDRVTMVTVCR